MNASTFAVLAEPTRLKILGELGVSELHVKELVERIGVTQPTVSKHLKVLRDAGFVVSRTAAQQRIYRIEPERFRELDAWLLPYRQLWKEHLEALEGYLDEKENSK